MRSLSFLVVLSVTLSCASAGSAAVMTDKVRIFDKAGRPESEWGYDPKEIRVASGTTVTFTNPGSIFHTVTSDAAQRLFDLSANPGQAVTVAFEKAGTFAYHCGVHPSMKGVVHVCDGECR
jgi:plastocyanin